MYCTDINGHESQQTPKFFTGTSGCGVTAEQIIQAKKKDLAKYVSKLDLHINKALLSQNKAMSRKRQNLLQSLNRVKEKAYQQTEKARKMQEYFVEHCQKMLEGEISKWDGNCKFFTDLFQFYEAKIQEKRQENGLKRKEVSEKTKHLKQILKSARKTASLDEFSFCLKSRNQPSQIQTQTSLASKMKTEETRMKTEVSLPNFPRVKRELSSNRFKTVQSSNYNTSRVENDVKSYMQPLKKQNRVKSSAGADLAQMLDWYRDDCNGVYNWFGKLVFVDRNFRKITRALTSA